MSPETPERGANARMYIAVLAIAAAVYVGCMISPPSLMDDVDAVQAQIARNMLHSGDWVTARLDGVAYLEKAPLIYWMIAGAYKLFGESDVVARVPVVLATLGLAWLVAAFGNWAAGRKVGLYAGMVTATCFGLFLFTRILIPDVMLTGCIALSLWAFLRTIAEDEPRPRLWALLMWASIGVSLLLKSLIGIVFPVLTAAVYLAVTGGWRERRVWRALSIGRGILVALAISVPWHVIAAIRNPPIFEFTMRSAPGEYHGFLWFYFINEQLLRFLNMRYPRDYDTVPRLYFWGFHLLWLFPWSAYLPAVFRLEYRPVDRAGRVRLLSLCWIGAVLVFFTFSTTQEYYSMPCYPAFALLIGSAMATGGSWIKWGNRVLAVVFALAAAAVLTLYGLSAGLPTPGDISAALSSNPGAYKLSLGHMEDLTIKSFAYLRPPLLLAAIAFILGIVGTIRAAGHRAFLPVALMCIVFFQAARMAMADFDPFLSSRPIAEALRRDPPGRLVIDHHYYTFSSVFFYTGRTALLLNGRFNNLVYGSYAPDAPNVFINDSQFSNMWRGADRVYLVVTREGAARLPALLGPEHIFVALQSGGKFLLTNHSL